MTDEAKKRGTSDLASILVAADALLEAGQCASGAFAVDVEAFVTGDGYGDGNGNGDGFGGI